MGQPFRGVYGILLTTFTDQDEVELTDLASQANFVAATAQGIVWPVLASEFYLLDDEEKKAGYQAVAEGNRGRVPFMAGITSPTTRTAARLAEAAAKAGADAVISMAPHFKKATGEELVRHFQAIAGAGLPICVQNSGWLGGTSTLSTAELRLLIERVPAIQYLKEEAPPLPETVSKVLTAVPGGFKGVFGGAGCRYLLDELNRGGAGNMPACEFADIFGYVMDLYERGELAEARRWQAAGLVGYNNIETGYVKGGLREVLRRRGIIRSNRSRFSPPAELDAAALAEIDATLEYLEPYLRWPKHVLRA